MANKVRVLSEKSLKALEMITENGPMTAMEMKEKGLEVNSSNLTALVNDGKVVAEKITVTVMVPTKRVVNVYSLAENVDENEDENESEGE